MFILGFLVWVLLVCGCIQLVLNYYQGKINRLTNDRFALVNEELEGLKELIGNPDDIRALNISSDCRFYFQNNYADLLQDNL